MLSLSDDMQRDLKRARIVLLAAEERSTRSIAKELGIQPRIVSLWRHRYADQGLEDLQDRPRPGKQPIYTKTTDKRILKLLDKSPAQGVARAIARTATSPDPPGVWRPKSKHDRIEGEPAPIMQGPGGTRSW